jgi:hypothetical protein
MSDSYSQSSTKFVVDLGPLQVPRRYAQELEAEMQQLALQMLTKIDYRGPLKIGKLPPGTWGYIFGDWPPDFGDGFPWPGQDQDGPGGILRVEAHTAAVQFAMEHPLALIANLPKDGRRDRRPSAAEALDAMVSMRSLPDDLRRALQEAQRLTKELANQRLPRPASAAVAAMEKRLNAAENIEDVDRTLRELATSKEFSDVPGFQQGLAVAQSIVASGRDSIYSLDNPFFEMGATGSGTIAKDAGGSVIKEDVKGAVAGGVGAAILTGGGAAAAGAVAGGIASSVGEVAGQVWEAITDLFDF